MVEKKYNYLYKITNLLNNKFYIGIHSTDDLDDNYYGSGLLINKAIDKYGIENFTKEILYFVSTREDLLDLERFIIDDKFINRKDTYNIQLGGNGGCSDEIKEKISNKLKGRVFSEEHRKKLSEVGHKRVYPPMSEETKQKISNSLKGISKNKGRVSSFKGKHHSEESKMKIRNSRLGKKFKKKN